MQDFRNLTIQEKRLRNGIKNFNIQEKNRILDALDFAKKAHAAQKRDEGDPYVIHPIRIANTLIYNLNITNMDMIVAGLLHDVIEDAGVLADEIREKFGERVTQTVRALTRDKVKETKKIKFEKAVAGPEDERLIKTCDWLDNLRSLVFRDDRGERWQRHLQEAKEMYIPLAKATGNDWLIQEMKKAYEEVLRMQE